MKDNKIKNLALNLWTVTKTMYKFHKFNMEMFKIVLEDAIINAKNKNKEK